MVSSTNDLFAPELLADPYPYLKQLREEDPVHWNEQFRSWDVTRYDDVVWVLRHPELFSSTLQTVPTSGTYEQAGGESREQRNIQASRMFIKHDRPPHASERGVLHGHFTPQSIAGWRPLVQSAVKKLLDDIEDTGTYQMD